MMLLQEGRCFGVAVLLGGLCLKTGFRPTALPPCLSIEHVLIEPIQTYSTALPKCLSIEHVLIEPVPTYRMATVPLYRTCAYRQIGRQIDRCIRCLAEVFNPGESVPFHTKDTWTYFPNQCFHCDHL